MPNKLINANKICNEVKISVKIIAANIVAVKGCINNPIDAPDGEIFPIACVIKYWPPN